MCWGIVETLDSSSAGKNTDDVESQRAGSFGFILTCLMLNLLPGIKIIIFVIAQPLSIFFYDTDAPYSSD